MSVNTALESDYKMSIINENIKLKSDSISSSKKCRSKSDKPDLLYREFFMLVSDLIDSDVVQSMDTHIHHNRITTLEHCISVAFLGFKITRKLNLNSRAAARGGLLHDLYLYDWHKTVPPEGLHGFCHPGIALRNAERYFDLDEREKNIILRHMWPMTILWPKYPESLIVSIVDKYCAFAEVFHSKRKSKLKKLKQLITLA